MKKIALAATFLMILSLLLLGSNPSYAQTNWAAVSSVKDLTGNATLLPAQPFLAGHAYNVTIKVTVPFTQQSSQFLTTLNGALQPHGAQFWYVQTPRYPGYTPSNFTAGVRTVSFRQAQGDLVLSSIFEIPVNITLSTSNGLTLHFPKDNFQLITVGVSGGSTVGNVTVGIQDETIQTYLSAYQQKSTLVSSGKVSQAYSQFVENILNQSQALYKMGLPDRATALVNVLSPEAFPEPPNPSFVTALIAGVAVAAIAAVILLVVALRGRGKHGYAVGISNEVQKELAALEVTASKYDKSLADKLKALRDKLGEAS